MGDSGIGSLIGTWKAFGRRYHGLRAGRVESSDRSGQGLLLLLTFAVEEEWAGHKSGNSFLSSSYGEYGLVWELSPLVGAGVNRVVRGMSSVIGRIEVSCALKLSFNWSLACGMVVLGSFWVSYVALVCCLLFFVIDDHHDFELVCVLSSEGGSESSGSYS